MLLTVCKKNITRLAILGILLLQPISAAAKCGGVDYSWGASALANAHDYVVTMMLYVSYLLFAIGGILGVIGSTQIYIKMMTGQGEISKYILMLFGAALFLISALFVFPAIFGYNLV